MGIGDDCFSRRPFQVDDLADSEWWSAAHTLSGPAAAGFGDLATCQDHRQCRRSAHRCGIAHSAPELGVARLLGTLLPATSFADGQRSAARAVRSEQLWIPSIAR